MLQSVCVSAMFAPEIHKLMWHLIFQPSPLQLHHLTAFNSPNSRKRCIFMVELYSNLRRLLIVYSHIKKSNPIFLKRLLLALYLKFLQPSFLNEDSTANGQEHTSSISIHPFSHFTIFTAFASLTSLKESVILRRS